MRDFQLADEELYSSLSREDKTGIAVAMAENLTEMQQFTGDSCGEFGYYSQTVNPFGKDFFSVVKDRILRFVDSSISYNRYTTQNDRVWIEEILEKGRSAIENSFTPTIVMQDYKLGNTVAEKSGDKWHISGIFDFQEWCFEDGEIDLYRTALVYIDEEDKKCLSAYIGKYLDLVQVRPGFKERLPVYIMLDRMIIWEWAQGTNVAWWDKSLSLKQWGEHYINRVLEVV